jgi:hypothetical protein
MFEVTLDNGRKLKFRFEHFRLEEGCRMSHVTNCYVARGKSTKFFYAASAFCGEDDMFDAGEGCYISLWRTVSTTISALDARDEGKIWLAFCTWRDEQRKEKQRRELMAKFNVLRKEAKVLHNKFKILQKSSLETIAALMRLRK